MPGAGVSPSRRHAEASASVPQARRPRGPGGRKRTAVHAGAQRPEKEPARAPGTTKQPSWVSRSPDCLIQFTAIADRGHFSSLCLRCFS